MNSAIIKCILTAISIFLMFVPLKLMGQEEIDMNIDDQFHFDFTLRISGMCFDGTYLWVSETNCDSLTAIDVISGEIQFSISFPENPFIGDLAYDGENLWASSQRNLYKISPEDGALLTSFEIPYSTGADGYICDLVWHNDNLFCLYFLDPSYVIVEIDVDNITCIDTLEITESVTPRALTFMNGYFWIDSNDAKILKINPQNGQLEGWFPHYYFSGNGIEVATDGEYMYCSDSYRNIFKYEIIENSAFPENSIHIIENPIEVITYPNPFNPQVKIEFELQEKNCVTLELFNVKGQKVKSLENNRNLMSGTHTYIWDANDLASGIYFVRLSTDNDNYVKKITTLK